MNNIRKIALRPFRLYVNFAGRSAPAEFWIFILIIVVALKLTSLATYGV